MIDNKSLICKQNGLGDRIDYGDTLELTEDVFQQHGCGVLRAISPSRGKVRWIIRSQAVYSENARATPHDISKAAVQDSLYFSMILEHILKTASMSVCLSIIIIFKIHKEQAINDFFHKFQDDRQKSY